MRRITGIGMMAAAIASLGIAVQPPVVVGAAPEPRRERRNAVSTRTGNREEARRRRQREKREARPCRYCDGSGQVADYIGLEMKCVGVDCQKCGGTGRRAPLSSEQGTK